MASVFGHIIASTTLSKILALRRLPAKFWFLTILSGAIPDLDVITFKLGIKYGDMLGHRGFTHSLAFAFVWAGMLTFICFRKRDDWVWIFALLLTSTLSHGFLDAFTNGGLGVGFFIPFTDTRYFFPFRPIEVSPIGMGRFIDQAGAILLNEFIWIGLPCLALLGLNAVYRKWVHFKRF